MARRKRNWGAPPKSAKPPPPFKDATDKMLLVERAMVYRMVKPTFTLSDVADYLWSPYTCHTLREAFKFCPGGTNYTDDRLCTEFAAFNINFDFSAAGMVIPRTGLININQDAPAKEQIEDAFYQIADVAFKCRKVYRAIDWLNDMKATPGNAKSVLPQLGSLLPAEHPFHLAKPAHIPLDAHIRPIIRDAVNVIVVGLLSDPSRDLEEKSHLKVRVVIPETCVFSQWFGIL